MFFVTWYHSLVNLLTVDGWAYLAIISLIVALVLLLVYLFSNHMLLRKLGFFGSMALFVVFLLCNLFAFQQKHELAACASLVKLVKMSNMLNKGEEEKPEEPEEEKPQEEPEEAPEEEPEEEPAPDEEEPEEEKKAEYVVPEGLKALLDEAARLG